jgi:anti-sigma-K factor RskA
MTDDRTPAAPVTLAAEYALGLLDGHELSDARRRALIDPDFASEIARWRGSLAPLHLEIDEVSPPNDLWNRIEAVTMGGSAANDNVRPLRRQLIVWRSAAGAMAAIAACLALVISFEPRTSIVVPPPVASQPASTPMVAMIGNNGAMKVVASWDPAGRQLILAIPGGMPADPVHSNELWVIPVDGKPRSLGTMPNGKQMHMRLADALAQLLTQGATIAISVEPRGGSPTGAPTGPVVASGALSRA